MTTVDIVVPTWNHSDYTVACFKSVAAHAPDARLLWIDNGSTEGERSRARDGLFMERLAYREIVLGDNLGFVKATNVGMAMSTSPYVLLMNNDCELVPGALEKLLDVMQREPKVGLVGPRASGTTWQARVPGRLNAPEYRILHEPGSMLAFFCVLVRREVIERIGYLSERYRMGYGDDDEYCHRAMKAGFQLALRTDVTVIHEAQGSFPDLMDGEEMERYKAENRIRLAEDLT